MLSSLSNMISFWSLKYLALHNLTFDKHLTMNDYMKVPWDKARLLPFKHHRNLHDVPPTLDLRKSSDVVHDQSYCNSCWAFSAAASINYHVQKIKPNAQVDVQNIINCAPATYGCRGGLMENVFEYKGHYPLSYSFKYDAKKHSCKHAHHGVKVNSFIAIEKNIEDSLPFLLSRYGPVAVAVDFADQHGYEDGIIKSHECGTNAKHAVAVMGYTDEYWIIKNSIGKIWGMGGYGFLERGSRACGIETYAAVVTDITIV